MKTTIKNLLDQSEKNLKRIHSKWLDGNSYRNENEWKEELIFIKGRIEGYKRILELFENNEKVF